MLVVLDHLRVLIGISLTWACAFIFFNGLTHATLEGEPFVFPVFEHMNLLILISAPTDRLRRYDTSLSTPSSAFNSNPVACHTAGRTHVQRWVVAGTAYAASGSHPEQLEVTSSLMTLPLAGRHHRQRLS